MKTPFLLGERIFLRPLEMEDAPRCQVWVNDPTVNLYLLVGRIPFNRLREEEWFKGLYKDSHNVILGICLRDNNQHIGNCGLHSISWVDRNALFGIMIGEKEEWNKGYGMEATGLILEYAFQTLNLERVELSVFEFNDRAIRCYKNAGFREEGRLRKKRYKMGRYWDEIVMGILKEEWESQESKTKKE